MRRSFLEHECAPTTNGINGYHSNGEINSDATVNGSEASELELDAVIIGAGFAGVYLLHRLRQEGFSVKLVEAGSGLGGIWHWNNYPGARVDSQYPVYALSIPEVCETWQWSEEYPDAPELQRYFKHVDRVLDVSKDTLYNTHVNAARWDGTINKWRVTCDNGTKIVARFLNCCLGFAAKRYFPDWPGLEDFKGYVCHSSFWPADKVELRGKKIAVVGNGATGIQIAQTVARDAAELAVFVRTPNTCFPMSQRSISPERARADLETMTDRLSRERYIHDSGLLYPNPTKGVFDDPPEVRDRVLQAAWDRGGFAIMSSYNDFLTNEDSNRYLYDFWAKRVRARISDPEKREALAPLEPHHPILGKRASLEQDYYEQIDKAHVKLVDLKKVSVTHVVPEGIVTSDGRIHELDVIAVATGFDSLTGSFAQIDIRGVDNDSLADKWSTDKGALSYLGMTVHNFPNLCYTYGPHAPTAYANGPSIVEPQGEWIVDVMKRMRDAGLTRLNAKADAEAEWKETLNELHSTSLKNKVESWYNGGNIPGKPRQVLNYDGGVPRYLRTIRDKLKNDFEGFDLS